MMDTPHSSSHDIAQCAQAVQKTNAAIYTIQADRRRETAQ
jgi:hypothetical protein